MLSSIHFRVRIKQGQPVRSHKIIFENQAGNPCTLSTYIPYLEVKPNRSVRFHLYSNFYSEVKPDELVHFRIDSFRKLSRTNRQASAQLPHSEAKPKNQVRFQTKPFPRVKRAIPYSLNTNPLLEVKPDKPVCFHTKPFPRVKRAIPVLSQYKSSFGS